MDLTHKYNAFVRSFSPPESGRAQIADEGLNAELFGELLASSEIDHQILLAGLEESVRRFESLLSCVSGTFYHCELSAPWRAEFLSPGIESITGHSPEFFKATPFGEIIEPEDLAYVESAVDQGIADRTHYSIDYRIIHKSGERRWVHETGAAVYDTEGQPLFLEGFIADITEKKLLEIESEEARAEVEKLNERRARILESSPDCVMSFDRDWSLTFANEQALREMGEAVSKIEGKDTDVVAKLRMTPFLPALERAMNEREVARMEAYMSRKKRWYELTAMPEDEGITIFYRNISDRKELEKEITGRKDLLKDTLDSMPDIIWSYSVKEDQWYFNNAWHEFVGTDQDGRLGSLSVLREQVYGDLVHPDDGKAIARQWCDSERAGEGFEHELRLRHSSGEYRWILSRVWPQRGEKGEISRWYGTCTDIHKRMLAERELRDSQLIQDKIFDASSDCMKILDLEGNLVLINEPGLHALEIEDEASILGRQWCEFWPKKGRRAARVAIRKARLGQIARFSAYCPTFKGQPKWWDVILSPIRDAEDVISGILSVSRDISEQRMAAERLRKMSEQDFLTDLANRRLFEKRLMSITAKAEENGTAVGLMLLDLDHFKQVNDVFGHLAGDHLLRVFAKRLKACVSDAGFVARLGGDEFAIILSGIGEETELVNAATQLLAKVAEPISYAGNIVSAGLSIGCAMFPRDADNARSLHKHADAALYDLKASGRGGIQVFNSKMVEAAEQTANQLNLARQAIRQQSVEPYYQAKVRLETCKIEGFEALLRWWCPGTGLQPPSTVAEAFNDYDLSTKIGGLMQSRVLEDMKKWQEAGLAPVPISLNAAPAEFLRNDFAERLLEKLARHKISPSLIEVEITEHVFLGQRSEQIVRALALLRDNGIKIALDDFGTGYSSLSHLRDFPVDVLKIDKSFVSQMLTKPAMLAIVEAVTKLGPTLSLNVVAEGIETPEQLHALRDLGCTFGQGYLFGKAMNSSEIAKRIEAADWPYRNIADLTAPNLGHY